MMLITTIGRSATREPEFLPIPLDALLPPAAIVTSVTSAIGEPGFLRKAFCVELQPVAELVTRIIIPITSPGYQRINQLAQNSRGITGVYCF